MTTTLVLGGARSGKSRYAESLLRGRVGVTYVAPGRAPDGSDPEWAARVAAHRARRPAAWHTVETADLVGTIGRADGPLLIDCLATWLARLVDDLDGWDDPVATSAQLDREGRRLQQACAAAGSDVVIVSNEVGLGVVPATASGRLFRDELGRLNARVASVADVVALVVAGRVLDLSNAPIVQE